MSWREGIAGEKVSLQVDGVCRDIKGVAAEMLDRYAAVRPRYISEFTVPHSKIVDQVKCGMSLRQECNGVVSYPIVEAITDNGDTVTVTLKAPEGQEDW